MHFMLTLTVQPVRIHQCLVSVYVSVAYVASILESAVGAKALSGLRVHSAVSGLAVAHFEDLVFSGGDHKQPLTGVCGCLANTGPVTIAQCFEFQVNA